MICFPLDNTPYEAKDMGSYLATRTRGVFSSDGNLAVTPGESGLSVSVSPGLAWLKWSDYWGTAALQAQAITLNLDTADGALKRIDAIVCRLDKVNNRAEIVVKKGAFSSSPVLLPPVRDANYDELYIATVLIGAGIVSISASAITDQRLNEEYCGLMRDGVTGIPTASLHAQAQQILTELTDALNAQIVRQSAEFDAWFDDLKGKLGEDPATALQLQVDNLNAAVVGDAFQASGSPVSIAYAGAQRIAAITAYGENAQGGTTEAPVALTGVDSVFVSGNNLLPKAVRTETTGGITFTPNPDGSILVSGTATTNVGYSYAHFERALLGRTVCLSGGSTQAQVLINERLSSGAFVRNVLVDRGQGISGILTKQKEDNILYATIQVLAGTTVNTTIYPMLNLGESPLPYEPYQGSVTPLPIPRPLRRVGDVKDKCVTRQKHEGAEKLVVTYNVGYIASYAGESITTAWISSTGALSTGAEVAYVLSSPETYATDPLDIDNAAGPLTVMTGGELEVRMTELIGSRSPEFAGKMDKATYDADGDGVVDRAAAVPWDGVTGKPDTFTPSTHNHDDRYYTESEIDTKLNGKANSSHTHGVGDISGVLPSTKGGTGANKSVLAISSAIVTTESQGYANVSVPVNVTVCAVVSQGSATGQCYSISVIDPQTGLFSIQVKDYNGNPVANKTIRINYIAYSI